MTEEIHSLQRITRIEFSPVLTITESVAGGIIHTETKIKIVVHGGMRLMR